MALPVFVSVDQAYIAGLFHDCGILLMKKRFSESKSLEWVLSDGDDNNSLPDRITSLIL
jgi:HD-like signal output (HDOD) protein